MPISSVSRYVGQAIFRVPHKNGGRVPVMDFRLERVSAVPEHERTYLPEDGEWIDQIAIAMYRTPHLYHFIVERNPHLFWPLDVSSDHPLQIPPAYVSTL